MSRFALSLCPILACCCLLTVFPAAGAESAASEEPAPQVPRLFEEHVYLVLRASTLPQELRPLDAEHPLIPVLQYAHDAHQRMLENVRDYESTLTKRERVGGVLRGHETMRLRIMHPRYRDERQVAPLSVYLNFLSPSSIQGREVLYVEGENDDEMWVTRGGGGALNNVTLSLKPHGARAMRENRYPITEVGMLNLVARLVEEGSRYAVADTRHECLVRDLPGAKINGRPSRYIEVKFPVEREGFSFHLAQIFIDDELEVPVRFVTYGWPAEPGGTPPLLEEYTYTDIRLNTGLTADDFDRGNPDYKFYVPESK